MTAARLIRLLMELRRAGITDTAVLGAIERVPRDLFAPDSFADRAYENRTLPIGHGQTLSAPSVVALMTQALEVGKRHKVLEIGTGSGYQASILALLCRRLYTIERYKDLLTLAEDRFKALRLNNVVTLAGDGANGWPGQAPFQRIMVTAAAAIVPGKLVDQLDVGGLMLLPVGEGRSGQRLLRITRTESGVREEDLGHVRFVPLVAGALPADDDRPEPKGERRPEASSSRR